MLREREGARGATSLDAGPSADGFAPDAREAVQMALRLANGS